ncbi:MAG: class I SAM-dependent methyltransferase [Phycisphaerae bacterium]|nr:class I SAM-dependent methyltransferase [Phycisphaerae bacterium]
MDAERSSTEQNGPHVIPTREGYDRWAEIYDDENNPLITLEERLLPPLLGDVRGLSVADVGCGTGRHALRFAAAGAKVTGLDFSNGMLDIARTQPGADAVTFIEHDLARPLPLAGASFDRVLCCLVVEHITDVPTFLRELKRILRPEGFILISDMHPAMMLKGIQARFTDPATGRDTRPASAGNQISDYVMAATQAGLRFDHISEHRVDEALVQASPRAAKYLGWPLLLLMQLSARHE